MPTGVLDLSYTSSLTLQYQAVIVAMDRVLAAQLVEVVPILRWVLAIYVLITFFRFGRGLVTWGGLVGAFVRAVVIVFVLTTAGVYVSTVRTWAFETVPNGTAAIATGSNSRLTAPEQFDRVRVAIDNLTAQVRLRNTSYSPAAIGNGIATWVVNGGLQFWLAVQAYVWIVSIRLMAIAICLGIWFLLFELFERTRGFFMHWIGVVVGILAFQLASAIYLQISMQTQFDMLRQLQDANRGNPFSVDQMISNLIHVGNGVFGDALTMLLLPTIAAVSGGVGAHMAATRAAAMLPGAAARIAASVRGR